jgi:hypothetical protein
MELDHEKLDAYWIALDIAAWANGVLDLDCAREPAL